jgi:hypothetical protein
MMAMAPVSTPGEGSKVRRGLAALGGGAAAVALIGGCSAAGPSGSSSAVSGASAGGSPPAASAAGAAGGATTPAASGSLPASAAGSGPAAGVTAACATPGSYLTAIRTGRQATADRVVFEFAGKPPSSYSVTAVASITADASGKPVTVAGASFLRVTFRGASAVCPATGHTTYAGPAAAAPGYAQLRGLAAAGDFEGYLTWGIGLAAKGGYRAYALTAPYRVVIDLPRR